MIKLTIDEAKALLEQEYTIQRWDRTSRLKAALQVGIDALDRIKAYRELRIYIVMVPLKGEVIKELKGESYDNRTINLAAGTYLNQERGKTPRFL